MVEQSLSYVDQYGLFKHEALNGVCITGVFQWEGYLDFYADILLDDEDDEDYYDEY